MCEKTQQDPAHPQGVQLPVSANLRRTERNKSFHTWYALYVFCRYKLEFRYISYVVDIVGYIIITAFLQSHGFALPVMLGTGFTSFPAFSCWSIDLLQNTEDIARLCRSHTSDTDHQGTTSTQKATLRAAWAPSCRAGNLGRRNSAEYFQTKETLRCRTPSTHLDCRSCKMQIDK